MFDSIRNHKCQKIEVYDILFEMVYLENFFKKSFKKSNVMNGIIYNKYVLYAVFVAALFDLLNSVVNQDYLHSVIFILVGFLIAFFNKNMTVILTLSIAISTDLRNVIRGTSIKLEGFKEPDESDDDDTDDDANRELQMEDKNTQSSKDSDSKLKTKLEVGNESKSSKKSSKSNSSKLGGSTDTYQDEKSMQELKGLAEELQKAQVDILSGFGQIEPHMDKAEKIIEEIQGVAQTIQGFRNSSGV